jgi:hypothetical protein
MWCLLTFRHWRLRRRRPRFVFVRILAVNRLLNLRHRFAFVVKLHRVTRDVETDVSYESHPIPLRFVVGRPAFDKTIPRTPMPTTLTSAIAGRIFHNFGMTRGEGIHCAHLFNRLRQCSGIWQRRPRWIPGSVLQRLLAQFRCRRRLRRPRRTADLRLPIIGKQG